MENEITKVPTQEDLELKILEENNIDELNSIIGLFNINMKKKDILRSAKLNELQDKIVQQMEARVESNADQFSNKDLLDYFKATQETLNKSDNTLDSIDATSIQFNQNNLNITVEDNKLNRESRQKVLDAVNLILKQQQSPNVQEAEIVEEQ